MEIGEELTSSAETVDASGLHVFSGVVDAHVHLNEPGRTDWEGFETGTRALAAGGATTFLDMPLNSSPPVLTRERFEEKARLGEQKSLTDFGLWGRADAAEPGGTGRAGSGGRDRPEGLHVAQRPGRVSGG